MDYLEYCGFDLCGKDVVIIGRSEIVGKPLARMMTDADATVTLCHSKSYLEPHIKNADLIVCAVGKPQFLDCSKINVPVIDVGINFDENGKLCGDCYNSEGRDITPVPGGVGLLTRCALLDNVISAKEKKCG
jgi:methylenetetrahydrofolate dehydrogenase (NADP+)/methenyltetrahydrofolate cyclohydrolase